MPQVQAERLSFLDIGDLIQAGVFGKVERIVTEATLTANFAADEIRVQDCEIYVFRDEQVIQVEVFDKTVDLVPDVENTIYLGVKQTTPVVTTSSSGPPRHDALKIGTATYSSSSTSTVGPTAGLSLEEITLGPNRERIIIYDTVLESLVVVHNE